MTSRFFSDNPLCLPTYGAVKSVRGPKTIIPGTVFDLTLPLEKVAEGYRAMNERRAIKALLRV